MNSKIEKTIELKAPISKVWDAITDHKKFGEWFRAVIETPFVVGEKSHCRSKCPGYEHMEWDQTTVAMEPETYFAFRWPHADMETGKPYSADSITLVEFRLEEIPGGTRLTIIESGFEALPENRRDQAYRDNSGGWEMQTKNIQEFLAD